MPRFFCDAIAGGKAVITGEDAGPYRPEPADGSPATSDPLGRAGHRF